jgi:hypothetical protein
VYVTIQESGIEEEASLLLKIFMRSGASKCPSGNNNAEGN